MAFGNIIRLLCYIKGKSWQSLHFLNYILVKSRRGKKNCSKPREKNENYSVEYDRK